MRIGIIGDGNVGSALEQGFTRAGHDVQAVGREPGRVKEVARFGEIVVLAVPFNERENALREMGDAVHGKVLIDVTNAVTQSLDYARDLSKSGAEELQEKARQAKVVKAFNTVFAQNMADGKLSGEPLTLFVAGDDEGAKRKVVQLGRDIGFDPVDAGPLRNARWLETLGVFNMALAFQQNMGPGIGFKLVHEGAPRLEKRPREREMQRR